MVVTVIEGDSGGWCVVVLVVVWQSLMVVVGVTTIGLFGFWRSMVVGSA